MSKIKNYETTEVFSRAGVQLDVGTRLTLHDNEAKYLLPYLRELNSQKVADAAEQAEPQSDEVTLDPRAEALLPLIDRRATTRPKV
ncbi:hypothetical protein [Methylobacterium sp. WL120]|uniref:hypothetical protein n=1 Tax=Methylobacterium sp. WL120 TaxID=2603887 RepID=UPI0011C934CE|nr:hypothetical protein [Methylobacterium sp. WL120]TXM68200.1 hypothetical protein FV229_08525 [Methylobacterium sp. WL120]